MKRILKPLLVLIPIICLLALASYLRLFRIADYMTFLGDEGRDVLVVKRMIVDHKWTLLGPTASVGGFFMGPIYYYFMLPFLWAWKLNPVGPAIMVGLVGIATVYLVYVVGSKWFSKRVGFIAALLYALSPIVIAFSRSSWNPNIVPFFALLSLYLLWVAKQKNTFSLLFWVGLCAGIGVQLHYTYLFLIMVEGLLILFSIKKIQLKDILLGLLGFILGFSPFLAFELRHGFSNTKAIIEFVFAGKDTGFVLGKFFPSIYDVTLRLFGRFLLRIPEVGTLGNLPASIREPWKIGQLLLSLGAIGALLGFGIRAKKQKNPVQMKTYILLLTWLLVPLLFFGIYKKNIYDYYFGIMFPLPFFLTALLIDDMWRFRFIGKWIGILSCITLAIFNWQGRPFIYAPNRQLAQVEAIAKSVVEKTDGKPFNFALITPGNSDHAYRYFFEIWNRAPITIENAVVDPERKTVTDQLLIVCEDIFCEPLGNSLWEVAGFGRGEIELQWDVSVVKLYKLIPYQGE